MTRSSGVLVLGLALIALLLPRAAEAQPHRSAAGFTTGGTWISDLNTDASDGARSISPGAGAMFGLYADRWYGDQARVGLRYQGAYQRPSFDWSPGERRISALSGDVSLVFRILPPEIGQTTLPWVAVGAGGIWYDLGKGDPTTFGDAEAFHDGSSRVLPAFHLAGGVDLDVPWDWQGAPMRVRLEIADHIALESPVRRISDGERYGAVHHVRFTVGLQSIFDFLR